MNDYERAVFALEIINKIIEDIEREDIEDYYNDQFYPNISPEDVSAILNLIRYASVELI